MPMKSLQSRFWSRFPIFRLSSVSNVSPRETVSRLVLSEVYQNDKLLEQIPSPSSSS